VQLPCNRVEQSDKTGFADAAAEEGVCGESPEGVVADLGVGWRGATVDEVQVGVRVKDRRVYENEPDVDAQGGLGKRLRVG